MAETYQCPRCKSKRFRVGYPDMQCFDCGYTEPLIDFPISWDWHPHYCRFYGLPDPGPCEPPEHDIEELHERVLALEKDTKTPEKPTLEPRLTGGIRL